MQPASGNFPDLFPDAQPADQPAWVDQQLGDNRLFVYPRQRGEAPLCRLEMKFPRQQEVFYLRHALLNFPKSNFLDCRRHNGKLYPSYEEALRATGLFASNEEAHAVLDELIALRYTAQQLRFAFCVLLEQDAAPITLFKRYEKHLMKDFLDRGLQPTTARRELLQTLHRNWRESGNLEQDWKLDAPDSQPPRDASPQTRCGPTAADGARAKSFVEACSAQRAVADHVLTCRSLRKESFVFVEGRAGTGKSTLATYLTHSIESTGGTVVNVASTGQAALLLPHGATAHSTFGIPIADEPELTCTLATTSTAAKLITQAAIIQWDEWPSIRKAAWEAVLSYLRTLQEHNPSEYIPKVFVCYGDFRQIPPVIPRASRNTVVLNSVRSSPSWSKFAVFHLDRVFRQQGDPAFLSWVDSIGDGSARLTANSSGDPGYVALEKFPVLDSETAAIEHAFPHPNDPHACSESKILAALNTLVDAYNHRMLELLRRTYMCESHHSLSADTLDVDAIGFVEPHMTAEFLNLQVQPGVPPHSLHLVVGALYELMRNFSAPDRLMNHVPVILKEVHAHHVLIQTLDGNPFPLPRICFRWTLAKGVGSMVRRQYPLRPAYASTYNGAQGRTLKKAALDVRHSPFAHGHLYVAASRVCRRDDLAVLPTNDAIDAVNVPMVRNVVWPELLLRPPPQSGQSGPARARKRPASALHGCRTGKNIHRHHPLLKLGTHTSSNSSRRPSVSRSCRPPR